MSTTTPRTIGLLHPGAMGSAIGALLSASGLDVLWCSDGRSDATRSRAQSSGLRAVPTLRGLVEASDVVVSVVPPDAATDVARAVLDLGLRGVYLDANAIAPDRAREIGRLATTAGARFVDGAIMGPPPTPSAARPTTLCLSGADADAIARLFGDTPLDVRVVSQEIGAASAAKMAFAAWTKGSTALRIAVLGYAEAAGVEPVLEALWAARDPGFWQEGRERATAVTAKAWRFEGEMRDIAAAFASEGVPGGFHDTAAEVFRRLAPLRDAERVDVGDVVAALTDDEDGA